jgi:hypothetical protein
VNQKKNKIFTTEHIKRTLKEEYPPASGKKPVSRGSAEQ